MFRRTSWQASSKAVAASEASLKYAVYGAGAAGIMLYGISLLAGLTGSAHLPTIATKLAAMDIPSLISAGNGGPLMVLVLAGLMIMVGLAFKLSAVPFHFWCPDVFEAQAPKSTPSSPSRPKPRPWPSYYESPSASVPVRHRPRNQPHSTRSKPTPSRLNNPPPARPLQWLGSHPLKPPRPP